MTSETDRIKALFGETCEQALKVKKQHEAYEIKNRRYKNFHSLTVTFISIFTGFVLFFILQDRASNFTTLLGSVLSFIAASCASINSYFHYPENEASHKLMAKRLRVYIISCEQTVKRFEAGRIDENQFGIHLDKHLEEYRDIVDSGPNLPSQPAP